MQVLLPWFPGYFTLLDLPLNQSASQQKTDGNSHREEHNQGALYKDQGGQQRMGQYARKTKGDVTAPGAERWDQLANRLHEESCEL